MKEEEYWILKDGAGMGMGKEEGRDMGRLIKTKNLWGEKALENSRLSKLIPKSIFLREFEKNYLWMATVTPEDMVIKWKLMYKAWGHLPMS